MGKKGKKGGKKGKKKEGEEALAPEQEIMLLKRQVEVLKAKLCFETSKASEAQATMREYRHRFVALNQDFEEEKERTFGLVTITVVKEKLEHAKLEVKDT